MPKFRPKFTKFTADDVIFSAERAAKPAMRRLSYESLLLHDQGYHQWSAAVSNMRTKIETALNELIDEVSPKE